MLVNFKSNFDKDVYFLIMVGLKFIGNFFEDLVLELFIVDKIDNFLL